MTDHEGIPARVEALEAGLDDLRLQVGDVRELATGAYQAVGDQVVKLQAHVQTLNALRQTQLEQGRTLQVLAETVGQLVIGQERHTRILGQQAQTLDHLAAGQARVEEVVLDIATTVHELAQR